MGVNLGSAYGKIEIDTKGVTDAVATAKREVGGLSDSLNKIGDGMTTAGTRMTAGITAPLVGLGVVAFKSASDLSESMNKVGVVFDDSAAQVSAWSESSADALGLSQQAALEAVGTFGNLFTSMGMGSDTAADMSTDLVQLGADLGSFNNIRSDEALLKLRAGLLGEAEPLRSLGVSLTAAGTTAKAMEMGLADSTEALTPAMLMQARYAIILEQTKNAQGDFARTSDGAANSLKIAGAEMGNAAASMGVLLLPMMTQVIQAVTRLVDWFGNLSTGTKTAILVVAGIAAVAGPVLIALGSIVGAVGTLSAAFGALGATTSIALGPIILVIAAIAAAVALLYLAWTNNWGGIQEKVAAVWAALQPAFTAIQQWLGVAIPAALALLAGFWTNTLLPAIQAVWSFIQTYLMPIFSLVGQVIGQLVRIELMMLQAAFENWILPALQAVWGFIQANILPGFRTMASFIGTVIDKAVELEKKLKIMEKGWLAIKTALEFVIDKIRKFLEALKNVQVPKWLEGGSPPPMANWLADIAEQARAATRSMGMMGAGMGGMGGLAYAGAGGWGGGEVYVEGDSNTFYVTDNGTAALTAAMIDERRRARLDASMGVYRG